MPKCRGRHRNRVFPYHPADLARGAQLEVTPAKTTLVTAEITSQVFVNPPKNQLINQGNVFVPGQPPSQGGEQHWHELGTWGDGMAYDIQWYAGMVVMIMIYDD